MICDKLTNLLGYDCLPLSDSGQVALVHTPFKFEDGASLPVFIEFVNGQVRFFDDGATLRHFMGRGVKIENRKHTAFLTNIANAHQAVFSESGEIETWASMESAPVAFSRFLSSMLAIAAWEKGQEGEDTDTSIFVQEVAIALRAWKPTADLTFEPPFEGITKKSYKLDFLLDGRPVVAVGSHQNSVSSLLHKLVDIHNLPENRGFDPLVVIDDRRDPEAADKESKVLQSLATVMPFSSLERQSRVEH
ncbi:DUF1828 domain-containing protein [Hydrogenophaga sp. T2]|uniref:DUF1828 domain-containing protein n=1 Tax=Hydrogenophaga sp. T2 TaxID=3132823 RepID=UPI003CF239C0